MTIKQTTSLISARSPAKVNIGLRILSKRKDGFHSLETVFYPVKIYDDITVLIQKLPDNADRNIIAVNSSPGAGISGKNNICYKAAELFFKGSGIKTKYKITVNIKKNIPMGAGMGGGSSDAASVLKILHNYFQREPGSGYKVLKKNQYSKIKKDAACLGSDVPFFLFSKPAYAEGRGEKLTPLTRFVIKERFLIINPGIHIPTSWAFKQLGVNRRRSKIMNNIKSFSINNEILMINDFERVVFKKYPAIQNIKFDMFKLGASFSLLSGSGSTVYGLFNNTNIKTAEKYFINKGFKVFVS